MIKVKRVLGFDNGLQFQDMKVFKTENNLVIFDEGYDEWVIISKFDSWFETYRITDSEVVNSLDVLDDLVFEACGEHIEYASDDSGYVLILDDDDNPVDGDDTDEGGETE